MIGVARGRLNDDHGHTMVPSRPLSSHPAAHDSRPAASCRGWPKFINNGSPRQESFSLEEAAETHCCELHMPHVLARRNAAGQ